MTRARDVADTQENLGGGVPPFAAGKNKVLNGDFGIWQRGTSIAVSSSASPFVADRWRMATNANQNSTVSRQLVNDTTNLPEIQYCLRYQRDSGQTGVNPVYLMQYNETISCVPFAGKTVTLSFYARKGANFSSASSVLSMGFQTGTGTDQNLWNTGYTNQTTSGSLNATLTSTMQRFSATFTIPTNTTEFGYWFYYTPTGTAGAADYFEITGVQLEAGSVATPFTTATGTTQGELAACQRYYWKNSNSSVLYITFCPAVANTTTQASGILQFPVSMRTNPTTFEYSNISFENYAATQYTLSSVIFSSATVTNISARIQGTISGATAGHAGYINGQNSTAAYIAVSAEL